MGVWSDACRICGALQNRLLCGAGEFFTTSLYTTCTPPRHGDGAMSSPPTPLRHCSPESGDDNDRQELVLDSLWLTHTCTARKRDPPPSLPPTPTQLYTLPPSMRAGGQKLGWFFLSLSEGRRAKTF
ncbi:hypothetical protein ACOMHN_019062 [Nucella lapillus]